jgi:cell division protein FtsB
MGQSRLLKSTEEPHHTTNQWRVLSGMRRRVRHTIPTWWWFGLAVLMGLVVVLYVHTVIRENQVVTQQRELKAIQQKTKGLRSQLAGLENPRRVESKAIARLSMHQPSEIVFLPQPVVAAPLRVEAAPAVRLLCHEAF